MQEIGVGGVFWLHGECNLRYIQLWVDKNLLYNRSSSFIRQIWLLPAQNLTPALLMNASWWSCRSGEVKKRAVKHHLHCQRDAAVQIRFHGNWLNGARACFGLRWQKDRFKSEWEVKNEEQPLTATETTALFINASWIPPNVLLHLQNQHNSPFVYIDPFLLLQRGARPWALLSERECFCIWTLQTCKKITRLPWLAIRIPFVLAQRPRLGRYSSKLPEQQHCYWRGIYKSCKKKKKKVAIVTG